MAARSGLGYVASRAMHAPLQQRIPPAAGGGSWGVDLTRICYLHRLVQFAPVVQWSKTHG